MALLNTSSLSLYLVLVAMEMDLIGLLHLFLAQTELTLLDVPKAVAWVGKSIVACIKKDLYLINVRSTVGFTPFPCGITPLSPPPPPPPPRRILGIQRNSFPLAPAEQNLVSFN